jgi:general stress protein YciG
MRIKKLNTPLFFTTTTKFGVELINSAPKKCPFRYDIVWVKSSNCGFLSAKKMPMRKHEMVYVFYEKLPFYDLSSHTHKFIKEGKKSEGDKGNECYGKFKYYNNGEKGYEPPLPVSVVKEEVKEGLAYKPSFNQSNNADNEYREMGRKGGESAYDPPLPTSVVKDGSVNEEYEGLYGGLKAPEYVSNNIERNKLRRKYKKEGKSESAYDPPLPTTMLEIKSTRGKHSTEKPVALMEWVLKYYSKEGDVVLDPTMGSGSTGVACKNMNRNFIGIEMDKEIFKIAESRVNA